jgi:hypothetical protein
MERFARDCLYRSRRHSGDVDLRSDYHDGVAWDVAGRAGEVRDALHRRYPVMVKVICRRCGRCLDYLFGSTERPWEGYQEGRVPRQWVSNERRVRWQCRCGADYPVRTDSLFPVYQAAARRARKKDRLIELPLKPRQS